MEDLITTQWGERTRPFRSYPADELNTLLGKVSVLLEEILVETGISVFLSYGCLLGAIRTGKVIPHDFDIDVGFVIPNGTYENILNCAERLTEFLIEKGFIISAQSNGHFKAARYIHQFSIDVEFFAAWNEGLNFYHYFGVRGDCISDSILPLGKVSLNGFEFPAPNDPRVLLSAIYGEKWISPDPSFRYNLTARDWESFNFLFTDKNKSFWDDYYSNRIINKVWLESPSQFAAFIGCNFPQGTRLLDIGCGNGRDSIFFATLGFDVTSIDYSQNAIEVCSTTADHLGLKIATEVLSISSFSQIIKFSDENLENFDVVYARFFLHAIDENSERNLLRLAYKILRPEGKFVLEYRCLSYDEIDLSESAYENGQHYRRLIRQPEFENSACDMGFKIEYSVQGYGHAKFRSEDPLIGRTILKKQ
jgi:cyclopropane fatty-acyl-phospholipid synthase-like methyltransferase